MLKNRIFLMMFSFLSLLSFVTTAMASADELMELTLEAGYQVDDYYRPKSSMVIDGNTGSVLWEDDADLIRDPASMSKMMTLYLVFEALERGDIRKDTIITATELDQAIASIHALSNNKIYAGVDYTVDELILLTVMPSSNVATVMLANYLSDNDPDSFLDMMNQKSKALGMSNTKWFNASGAAAESFLGYYSPKRYDNAKSNQTTARDLAILVYHFINKYPDILTYTTLPEATVKAGTVYEESFHSYNHSLPGLTYGLEGVQGLKTGSSPSADFNYMVNADRNGQKVIALIMGVGDWSTDDSEYYRHAFGNALIEKAYSEYDYVKVLSAGEHDVNGKTFQVTSDVFATLAKGTKPKISVTESGELQIDNNLKKASGTVGIPIQAKRVNLSIIDSIKNWLRVNKKIWSHLKWILLLLSLAIILGMILFVEKKGYLKKSYKRQMDE